MMVCKKLFTGIHLASSIGFGHFEGELHVALGQVYVIRSGFDIKLNGTSSLNSGFGIAGLPLGTDNCRVCWR